MTFLDPAHWKEAEDRLRDLHVQTRKPSADYIERKPVGSGTSVDFMGHAAVTDALLASDPFWSWSPLAHDEQGLPLVLRDKEGRPRAMWGKLTVHGVTRIGVGTCDTSSRDPLKELIGDFIRNAAMRFGVGLTLWSKSEWQDVAPFPDQEPPPPGQVREERGSEGNATDQAVPVAPSEPSSPSPGREFAPYQNIVIKCREMGMPDSIRHGLVQHVTKDRTTSTKELYAEEAALFHKILFTLRGRSVPEGLNSALKEEIVRWQTPT